MRDVVADTLRADPLLMATLTGGVHTARELSRQTTAAAFDANGELRPAALVRFDTVTRLFPGEQQFVSIYLYQRDGTNVIDVARGRIHALLHEARLGSSGFIAEHVADILDQEDAALECNLHVLRYQRAGMRV